MHLAESSSTSFCLWTGLSLPVALHLASQRRSYLQLRTGQCSRPERTFTLLLVRTFRRTYPGTSCLATISLSLRDKSHSPFEAPRNYLSAYDRTDYRHEKAGWMKSGTLRWSGGESRNQPADHASPRHLAMWVL